MIKEIDMMQINHDLFMLYLSHKQAQKRGRVTTACQLFRDSLIIYVSE